MAYGSQLLTPQSRVSQGRHRSTPLVSLLCGLLAIVVLFTTIFASLGNAVGTLAHAEETAEGILNDAADDFGVDRSPEGFEEALEQAEQEGHTNTFSAVLYRLFSTGYINYVPNAVPPRGENVPDSGYMCNTNAAAAGTLVYHNCDVPNLVTEFFQDVIGNFTLYGVQNADTRSATIDNRWFGLPTGIPGNEVPVDPSERSVKYTALELFGYAPLVYTTYEGEWDHIKTMSEARALANYGAMDKITLGANVITDSVAAGIDGAVEGWRAGMESGNILSAIGGALSGTFEGALSGGVNTVLDTSDYNILNSHGWYRVNFGGTLYNARELTQQELAAEAQQQFINMVAANEPDTMDVPEDLQAVEVLPDAPTEAIASCSYRNANGDMVNMPANSAPGPTEEACEARADQASESGNAANSDWSWDAEGTQAEQSLSDWKDEHSNYFDVAEKYGLQCDLSTNEGSRADNWAEFSSCWNTTWPAVAAEARDDRQVEYNNEWVKEFLDPAMFADFMAEHEEANFNAPYNRFVCVDRDGNDIMGENNLREKVYDSQGNLNENCTHTRKPIQDGLFGNGYPSDIASDTRHQDAGDAIGKMILPLDHFATGFANLILGFTVFITRISNTIINLSFSPIFKTIGLDEIAISFIESLRDGIFFPLALFVAAVAGISIIVTVGRQQNYAKQFGNILLILLTFIIGVFMMLRPAQAIKVVDTAPAMVEQAILGAIFSAGSSPEDNMCTATDTVVETSTPRNLDGTVARYNPSSGLRSLMCENWRAFAFTPWVYGQYGTGMNNLYGAEADVSGSNNTVLNHNTFRVGNPEVRFGQGTTMNNWAVFQLDAMTTGTSTTHDYRPGNLPGSTHPDMYRIVDFQAGPDNGLGVDSRFFESWSGDKPAERIGVAIMSVIVGFFAAITIMAYSITKVTITFVSTVMLMFLPFMLLFGLYPGAGMRKLRGYIGSIIALMLQRVMIAVLLSMMLTIIMVASNSGAGYILVALLSLAVAWFFFRIRKSVMGWISEATASTAGSSFGGSSVADTDKATSSAIRQMAPGSLRNGAQMVGSATTGFITGGVGSFLAGGSFTQGGKQTAKAQMGRLHNIQRRKGFSFVQGSGLAIHSAIRDAKSTLDKDEQVREIEKDLLPETEKTQLEQEYNKALAEYSEKHGKEAAEKYGNPDISLISREHAKTRRDLSKLAELSRRLEALKKEAVEGEVTKGRSRAEASEEKVQGFDRDNLEEMMDEQKRRSADYREKYEKIQDEDRENSEDDTSAEALQEFEKFEAYDIDDEEILRQIQAYENQIETLKNRIIQRENNLYRHSSAEAKMRQSLEDMRRDLDRERPSDNDRDTDDEEDSDETDEKRR